MRSATFNTPYGLNSISEFVKGEKFSFKKKTVEKIVDIKRKKIYSHFSIYIQRFVKG